MRVWKKACQYGSSAAVLVALTVAIGAGFKMAAFAREVFIAARFGLSAVTDAYFALQQFPLTLWAYAVGAFPLAFVPAYAEARRRYGKVAWLHGLLFYGCLIGLALTALMLVGAPFLLHTLHIANRRETWSTLAILSICFIPVICIGIWSGICTARGYNLRAMSVGGVPYLIMTLTLFGLYGAGRLNNLSLPISFAAGFGLVGIYSLVRILRSQPSPTGAGSALSVWRFADFRYFCRQLGASSVENAGFAGNSLFMLHFLSLAGTGAISANNCAMRIGLLGYTFLSPLALLLHGRLSSAKETDRPAIFRRWIWLFGGSVLFIALLLFLFRFSLIRLVYMHGKFQGSELREVAAILPAWIAYFVVMCMNSIVPRYLFFRSQGHVYMRRQLWAYAAANVVRFAIAGSGSAAVIVWCSPIAEACALALNLRTSLKGTKTRELSPVLITAREAR